MGLTDELMLQYALDDLEDIKNDVAEIQKLIQYAEEHPELLPTFVGTMKMFLAHAHMRGVLRTLQRKEELVAAKRSSQ